MPGDLKASVPGLNPRTGSVAAVDSGRKGSLEHAGTRWQKACRDGRAQHLAPGDTVSFQERPGDGTKQEADLWDWCLS